jgi:hypothetical protein
MGGSLLVKMYECRATLLGAHTYVEGPGATVFTKAQFCDGHHNFAHTAK